MSEPLRRWKFLVEDLDGREIYLAADGTTDAECEWIGTMAAACAEAGRRADKWECITGNGLAVIVRYESLGRAEK